VIAVRTPSGVVTSFRTAWSREDGSPVHTWRTETDERPYDFGSVAEAEEWIASVWREPLTAAERADRDRWTIEEVAS
jgi:hypothetical protein